MRLTLTILLCLMTLVIRGQHITMDESNFEDERGSEINELLDINTINLELLNYSTLFSRNQLIDLIEYRNNYQGFVSIEELKNIPSINIDYDRLEPHLTCYPLFNANGIKSRSTFISRYKLSSEQPHGRLIKYHHTHQQQLKLGFTLEDDQGEIHTYKKFDYSSWYVQYKPARSKLNLCIGNLYINIGQGLHLWNGFSHSKSLLGNAKNDIELKANTGSSETNNLKGVAVEFGKALSFSLFLVQRKLDATTTDSSFTSVYSSGLHRTAKELERKNSIVARITGGRIKISKNRFKSGITISNTSFSKPWIPNSTLSNLNSFSGNRFQTISVDNHVYLNKASFFSESVFSTSGTAHLYGIQIRPNSSFKSELLYRKYSPQYLHLFNRGISENGSTRNEEGMLFSGELNPLPKIKVNFYIDNYQFKWLRHGHQTPARGTDIVKSVNYAPNNNIKYHFQIKRESQYVNDLSRSTKSIAAGIRYAFSSDFTITHNIQHSSSPHSSWLYFGAIRYKTRKLSCVFSYTITGSENNTMNLYSYEPTIRYAFPFQRHTSPSNRYSITGKILLRKNINLWYKLSLVRQQATFRTIFHSLFQIIYHV